MSMFSFSYDVINFILMYFAGMGLLAIHIQLLKRKNKELAEIKLLEDENVFKSEHQKVNLRNIKFLIAHRLSQRKFTLTALQRKVIRLSEHYRGPKYVMFMALFIMLLSSDKESPATLTKKIEKK